MEIHYGKTGNKDSLPLKEQRNCSKRLRINKFNSLSRNRRKEKKTNIESMKVVMTQKMRFSHFYYSDIILSIFVFSLFCMLTVMDELKL